MLLSVEANLSFPLPAFSVAMYPADSPVESEPLWTAHSEALAVRWVKWQEANKVLLETRGLSVELW